MPVVADVAEDAADAPEEPDVDVSAGLADAELDADVPPEKYEEHAPAGVVGDDPDGLAAGVVPSLTEVLCRPADRPVQVRTTVERPLAALDPVDPMEARQVAECFAVDYLSCDQADPDQRRRALAAYVSYPVDAELGWPGPAPGEGRCRALQARAGRALSWDYGFVVDVVALVEIEIESSAGGVPAIGSVAGAVAGGEAVSAVVWPSAVPPTSCSEQGERRAAVVWRRVGVPVRRHDSGRLVVDLQALPATAEEAL
ncbi:hypothetical protein [Pseudonocardia sp. ICBG1293]|uniref:hypothetical protein n=1 Tax=Pseudonocardia sp. ICBG1293 TaxID=2844382 RepID=UPI001CCAF1EC|nr:hypothetical protein [Pseudonocardia sp. ICBG1293]